MNDLETRLRTTLGTRAHDVTELPSRFTDLPALADATPGTDHAAAPPHARRWLVAAAVLAVLAIAGGAVAIGRSGGSRTTSPGTGVRSSAPTPNPDTSAASRPPHVSRQVSATRVAINPPAGYRAISWISAHDYRQVGLRPSQEKETPGSTGGTRATAFVTVFDPSRFDGYDPSWRTITFHGRPAYLGKSLLPGSTRRAATLVFSSARGRTVLVQGTTSLTSTDASLRTLAATVQPDVTAAVPVPFRLGALPSGLTLVTVEDDRADGSKLTIRLKGPSGVVEISVQAGIDFDGLGFGRDTANRRIAGRSGVIDKTQGLAAVSAPGRTIVAVHATVALGDAPNLAVLQHIVDGLVLTDAALEQAIP